MGKEQLMEYACDVRAEKQPHVGLMGWTGGIRPALRRFGVVLLVFGLIACGAPEATPVQSVTGEAVTGEEAAVVALLNERRGDASCPALTVDVRLARAARRHAVDMRDHGVRDHIGSDGSTAAQRVGDAGFAPASVTGEIIYWSEGDRDAQTAVAAWMGSPPHREIIRNCRYTHIGVSVIGDGGYIAVAVFAAH